MTKRYKLLKEWPDAEINDVYQWNGQGYSNQSRTAMVISKAYVEKYADWFQEIKEPEKIEISHIQEQPMYADPRCTNRVISFHVKNSIPNERFPAIKKAIENVLNNGCINWFNITQKDIDIFKQATGLRYTQQQMDESMEKAFNGARTYRETSGGNFVLHPGYFKYNTFQDYLSSLKK